MRILRVIASMDPATGGPVAGLRAVTPALAQLGHESEFLTVDEPTAGFLQSFVAPVHALGPSESSFAYSKRLKPWLEKHLTDYDAVVVHGLWQYLGQVVRTVSRQTGRPPYFVFPHGMLDPVLRRTYPVRHFKKWLYWLLAERRVERDARAVFFTCEEERRLARKTFPFYSCNERVVRYGTAAPSGDASIWSSAWRERADAFSDHPYWLFLGRLHSKKGVDLVLGAYAQLHHETPAAQRSTLPNLVLAGPCVDPSYLTALQRVAQQAGIAAKVYWPGMITGDAKWGALEGAEAFILPSYQENFGIAVAEALAVGTPVLVSDRVNIWREIAAAGVALVEPADESGTLRLLKRWQALDAEARDRMSAAARVCFRREFEVAGAAQTLADELSTLIRRPDSAG